MEYKMMTDAEYDAMVDEMVDEWAKDYEAQKSYEEMAEAQGALTQAFFDEEV